MGKFRFALILAVGAAVQLAPMSQPAAAADAPSLKDMPYEFVPLWTGLYFGGHAGAAWDKTKLHDKFDYVGDPEVNANLSGIGVLGGAQAGYNYQLGHFVFGLEGDGGYLGISANKSANGLKPSGNSCTAQYGKYDIETYYGNICQVDTKYSVSSNLYGDLTARAGFLMSRTLLYVKGGAAILDADIKENYSGQNCKTLGICGSGGPSTFNFDHSEMLVGWTAGAGVEYALNTSWSFKAEYQHFDFGKISASNKGCYGISGNYSWAHDPSYGVCPAANAQYNNHYTSTVNGKTDISITADTIKLGINYHLNNEAELK
jgi:outer membrane immunogenic protein